MYTICNRIRRNGTDTCGDEQLYKSKRTKKKRDCKFYCDDVAVICVKYPNNKWKWEHCDIIHRHNTYKCTYVQRTAQYDNDDGDFCHSVKETDDFTQKTEIELKYPYQIWVFDTYFDWTIYMYTTISLISFFYFFWFCLCCVLCVL